MISFSEMFSKSLTLLAILLTLTLSSTAQDKKSKELDKFIAAGMADWQIPGLAVTVVQDGKTLFTKVYGVKNQNKADKVDENTIFCMASTTKAVVAIAMAMLVDEGKIKWTDKVIDHVPYFQLADAHVTREATIKDLLTHNLGLGNADLLWFGDELDAQETIKRMKYSPAAYSLRSSFIYQNIMYSVAGEVIKSASGMEWNDFIQKRILDPLKMTDTKLVSREVLATDNKVAPHYNVDKERKVIPITFSDGIGPAGMMWSSIKDMNIYMKFLSQDAIYEGDTLVKPATFEYLFKPHTLIPQSSFYPTSRITNPNWTSYGLGWFQHDFKGEKVDFHTGSLPGLIAINGQLRSKDLSVYVFANMDHAELRHAIMYKVFDLYALQGDKDWHQEIFNLYQGLEKASAKGDSTFRASRKVNTSTSLPLEEYTGKFGHPMYGTVEMTIKDGNLYYNQNNKLNCIFKHWHYDTFIAVDKSGYNPLNDALITFEMSFDGNISGFSFGEGLDFKREN